MSEHQDYARWLDWGTRIALALLVATFLLYAFGVVAPHLPLAELPKLWGLPVDRFVAQTGAPTGWGWVALLQKGDYLNMVPVAMLCFITVVCYVRILPALHGWRAAVAVAQIVVLLGAALL